MQRSCYQTYVYGLFAFLNIWLLTLMPILLFLSSLPILESFIHFGWLCNTVIKSMDLGVGWLQVLTPAPASWVTLSTLLNHGQLLSSSVR